VPFRARPVTEFHRTRHDLNFGRLKLADTLEAIADDPDLGVELRRVGQVLEVASAADARIFATRHDPPRGRLENLDDLGEDDPSLALRFAYPHSIARRGKRDENRQAVGKPDPESVRDDPLDGEFVK